jgi:hypothetical protein
MGDREIAVDSDITEVARAIRPYLSRLVGADAERYDREIADLLGEARAGRDVTDRLMSVLTSSPTTLAWSAQVLEHPQLLPPDLQQARERLELLPGKGEPVATERFTCPQGDYTWYRISVSAPLPTCPTHGVLLTPA